MMWRFEYFYIWIPAVLVGAVVLLALPWLAVIALLAIVAAVVAGLGYLAAAFVAAVKALVRSVGGTQEQSLASKWPALEPSGAASVATAFAVPKNLTASAWFSSTVDESEVLEEAGINPIDVYEHPYMPVAWAPSDTAAERGSR
jgi:hypothetical protein